MTCLTMLTEGLHFPKIPLKVRTGQVCVQIYLLEVDKGCIKVHKFATLATHGTNIYLGAGQGVASLQPCFHQHILPLQNNYIAVCCTSSIAVNGAAGEAGIANMEIKEKV